MRQIRLGQIELQVSRIAFGTWAYGGDWGAADVDAAKASIHRALEQGIHLFDTAQGYGFGASQRLLGEALWERARRENVVIATKGGCVWRATACSATPARTGCVKGWSPACGAWGPATSTSIRSTGPTCTPPEETAAALEDLVREGKIRHAGVSNYDAGQMEALRATGRLETLQPPYHLVRREIEQEILPWCTRHDVGVLVYGPLAHGLLAGRMRPSTTFDPDDWRSKSPDFNGETFRRNLAVVERLKGFADERGVSLPQLAVAWTLANPAVHVAIVGARRPSQLDGTAPAADVQLSQADLQRIDEILVDAVPVWGPHPEGM